MSIVDVDCGNSRCKEWSDDKEWSIELIGYAVVMPEKRGRSVQQDSGALASPSRLVCEREPIQIGRHGLRIIHPAA